MLAIKDSGRQFDDARRDRTLRLLNEALKILDDHADMPEVGARLQGVIDNLAAARPK